MSPVRPCITNLSLSLYFKISDNCCWIFSLSIFMSSLNVCVSLSRLSHLTCKSPDLWLDSCKSVNSFSEQLSFSWRWRLFFSNVVFSVSTWNSSRKHNTYRDSNFIFNCSIDISRISEVKKWDIEHQNIKVCISKKPLIAICSVYYIKSNSY